jgi:agmatine deiminase
MIQLKRSLNIARIIGLAWIAYFGFMSLAVAQTDRYFPAEHNTLDAMFVTWDYHPLARDSITARLVDFVQDHAHVYINYYPGTAPVDTNGIRAYLTSRGVADSNYTFLPVWTETLWIRDYGPFFGYKQEGETWNRIIVNAGYSAYNRPFDDNVPNQLGDLFDIEVVDLPLELEGGNLLFDGTGIAFASRRIVNEQNPQFTEAQISDTLKKYFNLREVIFLDEITQSGGGIWAHVDMYIKVLNDHTLLISEYPDTLPDFAVIENNVGVLANQLIGNGIPYTIVRIPAPVLEDGTYATMQNQEMRTYTNAFTINDLVVVPTYNQPLDAFALSVYEEWMPGYTIRGIDARALTPLYGAIHCITNELVPLHLLSIQHNPIIGLQDDAQLLEVICHIRSSQPIDSVICYYHIHGEPADLSFPLNPIADEQYSAEFEGISEGDSVSYYISAYAGEEVHSYPVLGQEASLHFWIDEGLSVHENNIQFTKIWIENPVLYKQLKMYSKDKQLGWIEIFSLDGKRIMHERVAGNFKQIYIPRSGWYILYANGIALPFFVE